MNDYVAYGKCVDEWVAEKAAHKTEWSAFIDGLPSVYPELIRDSALRLGVWSNVRLPGSLAATKTATSYAQDLWRQGKLGTPHALDGCWWFADETLSVLTDLARRLGSAGDAVALFGAPTLFHYMRAKVVDRELFLVDRAISGNLESGQTVQIDMLQVQPTISRPASVSIVDPPWYGPETRAFLIAARSNSTSGARILLSAPPIGIRPGILGEWNEMVAWCLGIGLRLIERKPLVLRYLSPPFEANALRAAAVPPCPVDWRRGDLAIFECVEAPSTSVAASLQINPRSWRDVEVGRVQLKIRLDERIEQTAPVLEEIVQGSVLPTVSRRDERVQKVVLWTSGNRVFGSKAPAVLGRILDGVVAGRAGDLHIRGVGSDLGGWPEREIELTAAKLRGIIEIEELELEHWSRSVDASLVELAS